MSSLRQSLEQKLLQKLSPQQIQFIKLLQLNTFELEQRIEEELLENPGIEQNDEFEDLDPEKEIGENEINSIEDDLKTNVEQEVKVEENLETFDDLPETEIVEEKEEELFDISDYTSDDGDEDGFH
ncbi:MAG: hypothetical protein HYZ42_04510, partial [Bacteroidetes bacterium]|nr:hypothetical protein [Bacteroidota bacterium]